MTLDLYKSLGYSCLSHAGPRYQLMSPNCNKILQKMISIFTHILGPGCYIISSLRLCVQPPLHFLKLNLEHNLSLFQSQLKQLNDFTYSTVPCQNQKDLWVIFPLSSTCCYIFHGVHVGKDRKGRSKGEGEISNRESLVIHTVLALPLIFQMAFGILFPLCVLYSPSTK